jgi:hypothetical protein
MKRSQCFAFGFGLSLVLAACNAQISTNPTGPSPDLGALAPDLGPANPNEQPSSCSGCDEEKIGLGGQPFAPKTGSSEFVTTDSNGSLVVNMQGGSTNRYLWIADTTLPGAVKIDLDTLKIVGRFRTGGSSTSRTTVNSLGEAFIGARESGGTTKFGVTKIFPGGKTCTPKSGTTVKTSIGPDDVLPYGSDDCVAWHVDTEGDIRGLAAQDVAGSNHDSVCKDFNGQKEFNPTITNTDDKHYLWVGGLHGKVYKIDTASGKVLINTKAPTPVYGMALAGDGKLWMSNGNAFGFLDTTRCVDQASCDAATICTVPCTVGNCAATCDSAVKAAYSGVGGYGITVDYKQRVWRSANSSGGPVMRYDPKAPANQRVTLSSSTGTTATTYGGGIGADASGNVWAAHLGSHIARFNAETLQGVNIPVNTKGVAVDTKGRIFAVQYEGAVHMIEPGKTGALTDYKLTSNAVALKGVAYAYSDMTGVQTRLASGAPGWYRESFQPCQSGGKVDWQYLTWDVDAPTGTWAMFNIRSADTAADLAKAPWYTVGCISPPGGKGFVKISAVIGKMLEVEVRFIATGDLNKPETVLSAKVNGFSVMHRCVNVE